MKRDNNYLLSVIWHWCFNIRQSGVLAPYTRLCDQIHRTGVVTFVYENNLLFYSVEHISCQVMSLQVVG